MSAKMFVEDRSFMTGRARLRGIVTKITAGLLGSHRSTSTSLHFVETLSLGTKRQVFLIECDGERFLVTAAGDSISAPVPLAFRTAPPNAEARQS